MLRLAGTRLFTTTARAAALAAACVVVPRPADDEPATALPVVIDDNGDDEPSPLERLPGTKSSPASTPTTTATWLDRLGDQARDQSKQLPLAATATAFGSGLVGGWMAKKLGRAFLASALVLGAAGYFVVDRDYILIDHAKVERALADARDALAGENESARDLVDRMRDEARSYPTTVRVGMLGGVLLGVFLG